MKSTQEIAKYAREKYGQLKRPDGSLLADHAFRVAHNVSGWPAKQVAWLHDVLEDTDTTYNDLVGAGVQFIVAHAVVAMTREPGESYWDYILRLRENPIAVKVKIADLNDNLTPWSKGNLREKYLMAKWILENTYAD
jgi:(p)ppGpp synthase/HD superfamily hydrolase